MKTTKLNKLEIWIRFYQEWFNIKLDKKELEKFRKTLKPLAGSFMILVPAKIKFSELCERLEKTGDFEVFIDKQFKTKLLKKIITYFVEESKRGEKDSLYYLRYQEMDCFDKLLIQALTHFQTGQFLPLSHPLAGGFKRDFFVWDSVQINNHLNYDIYLGYTSFDPPRFRLEFSYMDFSEFRILPVEL